MKSWSLALLAGPTLTENLRTTDALAQHVIAMDRRPLDSEHVRVVAKVRVWTQRALTARRALMLVVCLASGSLVVFFAHSINLAIICALFAACLFDEISVAFLMTIGLVYLCAAGVLAVVEYAGWVNDSPGMTILAVNLGLVDLHDAGNRAAIDCLEAFTLGTIAQTLQLAKRRLKRQR